MHIIDALNYGGAQKLLVELAAHVPREVCQMVVCALQPPCDIADHLSSAGARVVCLNRPRPSIVRAGKFLCYAALNLRDIVRLCRIEHAGVMHCHLSDAEFLGILAGRFARVPRVVTTVHYPDLLPPRHRISIRNFFRKALTRLLYRHVNMVVAVSDEVAYRIRELAPSCEKKLRVIINGVDTAAFADVPPPAFTTPVVLCTVARLMPPKGHRFLIDAVHRLCSSGRNIRLLLAGDGDLRHELEERTRAYGLDDNVIFLGNRRDVINVLSKADIFVLPSLWEGTSLALLEAMAAARPIVASDIPGIRNVIRNGQTGLLAPAADPEGLAHAISVFIDNPDFAVACGQRARSVAREQFDIHKTIAALYDVWGIAKT